MGGWDYHCLLCSAGFHITYQLTNEDEYDIDVQEQKDYPFARLPRANIVESLEWLNNFRLIGQNRRATGIKQCFLSGPAQEEDYGEAKIELGDHPNARSLDHTRLRCYRCGTDESLNHPIHDECLVVLCEAFSHAQNFEYHWTPGSDSTSLPMDLDVLHQCVSGRVDKYHSFLGLRRNLYPDQYFWVDLQQLVGLECYAVVEQYLCIDRGYSIIISAHGMAYLCRSSAMVRNKSATVGVNHKRDYVHCRRMNAMFLPGCHTN